MLGFFLLVLGLIVGTFGGWTICKSLIGEVAKEEIEEYKRRWLDAVNLLGAEGQLTEEQIESITAPKKKIVVEGPKKPKLPADVTSGDMLASLRQRQDERGSDLEPDPHDGMTMREIHKMSNYYRHEIELRRLKAGLPPRDDLKGMSSYYKNEIHEARVKYAKRRAERN